MGVKHKKRTVTPKAKAAPEKSDVGIFGFMAGEFRIVGDIEQPIPPAVASWMRKDLRPPKASKKR